MMFTAPELRRLAAIERALAQRIIAEASEPIEHSPLVYEYRTADRRARRFEEWAREIEGNG